MHTDTTQRNKPRISVTKLGEYTGTNASRRRAIVAEQKRPRAYRVARYDLVRREIARFYRSGQDPEAIVRVIEEIESGLHSFTAADDDRDNSVRALEAFLDGSDLFEMEGLQVLAGPHDPPKLSIAGVDVSVRPDLVLRGRRRRTNLVGAVKFHIAKGIALDEEMGINAATVLHQYVDEQMRTDDEKASHSHCVVFDVFARRWHHATPAVVRRRKLVENACSEIRMWWDSL